MEGAAGTLPGEGLSVYNSLLLDNIQDMLYIICILIPGEGL